MQSKKLRCGWCTADPLYIKYHDREWGVPIADPQGLFERLTLEGMQAGLSWLTILKKREHMQSVFFEFDPVRLARTRASTIERWLKDPGIIRHRGKLEAMVGNAKLAVRDPSFATMLWSYAPSKQTPIAKDLRAVPSQTVESVAMSKGLKQVGYRFVGPTICYAFMQSVGMVNDHVRDCFRQPVCANKRRPKAART